MSYGNGNGGGYGQGQQQQRPPSFLKGSSSWNKKKEQAAHRDLNGVLKHPDGTGRWLDIWINHAKDDPHGPAKVAAAQALFRDQGLYLSIQVGDIAPPQNGAQQGGGYGAPPPQQAGGYGAPPPQGQPQGYGAPLPQQRPQPAQGYQTSPGYAGPPQGAPQGAPQGGYGGGAQFKQDEIPFAPEFR